MCTRGNFIHSLEKICRWSEKKLSCAKEKQIPRFCQIEKEGLSPQIEKGRAAKCDTGPFKIKLVLNKLCVHVYDSFVKFLLAAYLLGFAVLLSISYEVFQLQLAIFELLTLTAVE